MPAEHTTADYDNAEFLLVHEFRRPIRASLLHDILFILNL